MKRALLVLMLSSALFAQFQTNSESLLRTNVKRMAMGSSDITNKATYTTYDHAGIPLGIMEFETVKTRFRLGYKRLYLKTPMDTLGAKFDDKRAINAVELPYLRIGAPDKIYFDLNYSINPITDVQYDSESFELFTKTKPLHKFGFNLMGQMPDGRVRLGFGAQLFMGRETWDNNSSSRVLLGGENVGVMIGFNLHEALNLTIYGHAAGHGDSLTIGEGLNTSGSGPAREAYVFLQLPQIDVSLDIGQHDLPYLGNIVFTYAKNHFVYTHQTNLPSVMDDYTSKDLDETDGKADPIKTDSMGIHLKNMWLADLGDAGELRPALSFGLAQHWSKHMHANNGDNVPIIYAEEGNANKGWELRIGGVNMGVGMAYSAKEIVDVWAEYGLATMSYTPEGQFIRDAPGSDTIDAQIYNKVGIGLKNSFDKYPGVDMGDHTFNFLVGFQWRQENAMFGSYREWPLNHMHDLSDQTSGSKLDVFGVALKRYTPWESIKTQIQTMNVNFGLGASFAKKMVELDATIGIVNQTLTKMDDPSFKRENSGIEFGFDFTYNIQGERKLATEKKIVENPEEESDNKEGAEQ